MALIAHILGSKDPCVHASVEGIAGATVSRQLSSPSVKHSTNLRQVSSSTNGTVSMYSLSNSQPAKKSKQTSILPHAFKGIDMPFNPNKAETVQAQVLHAIISMNLSFWVFEDPEVIQLFEMIRSTAPSVLPSGEVIGGRNLNNAGVIVKIKIDKIIQSETVGLVADGRKSIMKNTVNGICINVGYKVKFSNCWWVI
jgi:hypothetical protein